MPAEPRRGARPTRRGATKNRTEIGTASADPAARAGAQSWLLLTYKVPAEPAKRRIALWRKLKALGAVYLQSGVCLLPKVDAHVRRLKVMQNEISAMDGDAVLLETAGLDRAQEEKVIARFSAERNEAYQELIGRCADFEAEIAKERGVGKFTYAEVEENEEDLTKLRAWLDKIVRLDFYGASLRSEAEERLARCAALLDDYAREVFEAQDESSPNAGQAPAPAASRKAK
jgi:DNA-binding transcriptional regulator PaaX